VGKGDGLLGQKRDIGGGGEEKNKKNLLGVKVKSLSVKTRRVHGDRSEEKGGKGSG